MVDWYARILRPLLSSNPRSEVIFVRTESACIVLPHIYIHVYVLNIYIMFVCFMDKGTAVKKRY